MVKYDDKALNGIFSALADPTRRAILAQLMEGDVPVMELGVPHSISLPAISKHLGVLEKAGLISRKAQGRERICHLHAEPMQDAMEWLDHYRGFWEKRLDALEDYLNAPEGQGE